ncbi:hypothetical protein FRC09_006303 [Ceratobasidium sp. 395]|nr:hypothetical protein FRC09_006303 [Ceratobasidium sp. 395]
MAEFVRSDVTEDQILPILRQLLPVLLHILGDPAKHSALTRARTISVFRQCVEALYMVKEQHPSAVSEATTTVLPTWLNAFQVLLAMDPRADVTSDDWDGLAVRTEIYRSLNIIHTSFPKSLSPYTPALLSHSLSHLQNLLPTFVNHYVQSGAVPPPSSSTDDPDQQVSLTHLASSLIDYVGSAVRTSAGRSWLESTNGALQSYIEMVAGWAQMTEEDEENWANNPNAFVAEEDDETELFSLRIAGFDLIMHFLDRVAVPTLHALQSVTHSAVQQMQNPSRPAEWWKPLEALLAVLGTHSESILEHIETEESEGRPKPIHVDALVRDIIPQLASTSEYPFLQGRAMVFASQYATTLPQDLQSQYLQAAWTVLQSETSGVPVKVSAVKAIRNFTSTIPDELVVGIAPQIIRDLAPFLLGTVEETLSLVLETLTVLLKVEKGYWLTPGLATSLTSALLDVWQKNVKDLVLLSAITDVFECLAAASYQTTVTQALPLLANALGSASSDETWITSSALDIITSLMRGAQEGQLGQGFFATLGAALFKAIGESEDRDVIQSVPFPTKALQLIVRELQSMGAEVEPMNAKDVPDTTEDDSDDADEWADEEKLYLGMKRDELAFLAGVDMEDGEADGRGLDDEDLRQDPISKIDMRAHLLQFLKECAAHNINNFSQTVEELGTEEMLVVHKAVSEAH